MQAEIFTWLLVEQNASLHATIIETTVYVFMLSVNILVSLGGGGGGGGGVEHRNKHFNNIIVLASTGHSPGFHHTHYFLCAQQII